MVRHAKNGQNNDVLVEIVSAHKVIECQECSRKFKRPVMGEGVTMRTAGRTITTCFAHLLVYCQSIIRVPPTGHKRTEEMADTIAEMLHKIYVENHEKSQVVARDMKESVETLAAKAII
jgi:hypothetical protein